MSEISQQLEGLSDQQGRILKEMEDQNEILKAKDERYDEAKARIDALAAEMAKITEERLAKARDAEVERQGQILADLADRVNKRAESKAGVIGQGSSTVGSTPDDFYWSLWASKSTRYPELNSVGKARLDAMGSVWSDVPSYSKATLGDTA